MEYLIVDAGGTSFKYMIVNNNFDVIENISKKGINIAIDFNGFLDKVENIFNKHNHFQKIIIGAAGAMSISDNQREIVKKLLSNHSNEHVFISDALLPLYATKEPNVICVTLGTGTSVFKKDKTDIKQYLGYGFAIGDIGSGYAIGKSLLYQILNNNDEIQINEVKKLLNIDNKTSITKYLYDDLPTISNKIASLSKLSSSLNQSIREMTLEISSHEVNKVINFVKKIIDNKYVIILNGGIFTNYEMSVKMFKKEFPNSKIILIENDPLSIVLKALKENTWQF